MVQSGKNGTPSCQTGTFDAGLLDLRAFCLVVDLGSITAAAKALEETKGGVSRRIARLEHGLGVELLRRSPRLDFDAHQIDVALRATGSLQDSSLIAHRLQRLEVGLFAAPAYLRKHGPVRKPDDLHAHRLLTARATRGHATIVLAPRDGREESRMRVRAAISASDFSFSREAALSGAGIAYVPRVIVQRDLDKKKLVPVLEDQVLERSADLFLVHQGTRFLPAKTRAFRDYVLEAFGVRGRRASST